MYQFEQFLRNNIEILTFPKKDISQIFLIVITQNNITIEKITKTIVQIIKPKIAQNRIKREISCCLKNGIKIQ